MRPTIRIRRAAADSPAAFSEEEVAIVGEDFVEGTVYESNGVRVFAFKVKHANIEHAYGFRVDYKSRSVVISGDMASNENFIEHARGADVVIHEVAAARPELLEKRPDLRHMLATHHSSPEDAGRDFARIKPKLAVYTHYSRLRSDDVPPVEIQEIIARTRTTYSGPLEAGEDLTIISIGDSVTVTRPRR
jgi:ribonuclease Z